MFTYLSPQKYQTTKKALTASYGVTFSFERIYLDYL